MPAKPATKAAAKTSAVDPARLRAWSAKRQGLGGALSGATAADALAKTGWVRSVGGSSPYLALFDRAGLSREAVDRAVAAVEVHELPSARGCTYVVPACDYALALRAAQGHGDDAAVAQAKKHLGVTDKELDRLSVKVLDALSKGALDPAQIKDAVGDAVRSLGEEGKRRGTTSTLPLVLGRLQTRGEIRRVPVNGRLDQQRYRYVRWENSPLAKTSLTDDEVARGLAERFFRWAGFGSAAQLAWWSGLGVKAARAAMAGLGLVALADGDDRMISPADRDEMRSMRPDEGDVASFVSSLDNAMHLRREVTTLLDDADASAKVFGQKNALMDLPYHAIIERGRLVGLWDYDGVAGALVWKTFRAPSPAARDAAKRVEAYVKNELGDARSFSLDSPEGRGERLAALRSYA